MAGQVFTQSLGGDQTAEWVNPYAAQIAAMQGRLNAPAAPMYTPEEVAQRKADNARQYQLGVLGALSGDEGLSNVGGMVFKQALAQRQPTVTERGVADPLTGQFHYSPDYLREKDEGALDKLNQLAAASQAKWQEGRQAAAERAATAAQAAADRRDLRAMMGANSQANRQAAADAKAEAQRWRGEDQLRGEFEKGTKGLQADLEATGKIKSVIGGYAGKRMDPFAQQSVVILLNKFLDPGSVVREGEFDRVVKAQGLENRAKMLADSVMRGDVLSPAAVQQITTLANVYEQAAVNKMRAAAVNTADLAQKRGLDVTSVIADPAFRPAAKPPAAAGGGGGLSQAEAAELAALRKRFGK